jgi:hypothetical protein
MQTELCSIGWPCGNPSLNIPDQDYRKYFESKAPNKGAIAYWEDGLPEPDEGPPPEDDKPIMVYGSWVITYTFDGETITSSGSTEGSMAYPLMALIEPYEVDGAGIVRIVDGLGNRMTVWGPRSNSDFSPITGVSVSGISMTREDNGLPIEPPPPPDVPEEPPETFIVMKAILKNGEEKELGREPFEEKPKQAWIACEDCEEHCVRMVKNPGDTYEDSLCLCKDEAKEPEPDEENMKDRIKAELLVEIPPIVIARFKATEEERFIDRVAQGAHKLIKPDLKDIVETILSETDDEGVSVLESIVLKALDTEIDNLPNLYASLKTKLIADADLLTGVKEALTTDKYTFKSLIAQLDDKNITELRTKMKIPLNPDDPKNPSNNDLTANGFKWQVVKNGTAIDKVQKTIEPADNITALLNCGDAIAAALQSKYSKQFSIDSSLQSDGKVTFDVSEI